MFVHVIWGNEYIHNYLNYTLASELADQNLIYFSERQSSYLILTRRQYVPLFQEHPLFIKLNKVIRVSFFYIDELFDSIPDPTDLKYEIFSSCHQIACLFALQSKSSVVYLPSDGVWGNGSLRRIGEIYEEGYKSIFLIGPRVVKETSIPIVEKYRNPDYVLTMTNRQVASLSINHLHPQMKSFLWNSTPPNIAPSIFIWPLGDNGMLFRCFHLHPILVDYSYIAKCKNAIGNRTIDSEIAKFIFPHGKNMYISTDSDEIHVITLSPSDSVVLYDRVNSCYTMDTIKNKLIQNDMRYCHKFFSTQQIFIHDDNLNSAEYENIINESDDIIYQAINL